MGNGDAEAIFVETMQGRGERDGVKQAEQLAAVATAAVAAAGASAEAQEQQQRLSASPLPAPSPPPQSSEQRLSGERCPKVGKELGGGCGGDHDEGGPIARSFPSWSAWWNG